MSESISSTSQRTDLSPLIQIPHIACEVVSTDLGGLVGGADVFPSERFDPLPTQRVPLWYFLRNPFLAE